MADHDWPLPALRVHAAYSAAELRAAELGVSVRDAQEVARAFADKLQEGSRRVGWRCEACDRLVANGEGGSEGSGYAAGRRCPGCGQVYYAWHAHPLLLEWEPVR